MSDPAASFRDVALNNSPVWLLASDLKTGAIIAANKSCQAGFGLPGGELQQLSELDFWIISADREKLINQLLQSGEATGTAEFRRRDGKRFWAAVACQVDASLEGGILWWITELAGMEPGQQSLQHRARLLEEIIDLLPVAVFAKDVKNDLRYVLDNRKSKEIFGQLDSHVLGKTDADISGPEVAEVLLRQDMEIIRTGKPFANPEELVEATAGENVYISTRKLLLRDSNGEPSLILGVCENVTERAETEAALRVSERRFRSLVSSSPVGIYLTDARGACMYVNEQWQKIAGLSNEQAAGRGWLQAVHPDDQERVDAAWRKFTGTDSEIIAEHSTSLEFRFVRPDGSVTWVAASIVAFKNENNQVLGYLGSNTDITSHKKYAMELQISRDEAARANAAKSSFLSRMSHELRTPLNAVLGFSQLLQMTNNNLTEKQKEGVDHIFAAGEHLLHLIEDVLDFSRADGGNVNMNIQEISVGKVVRDAVEAFTNMADQYEVSLVTGPDSGINAIADQRCLQQILKHLLDNAIKYNRKDGEVEVVVNRREGNMVRISVSDTGTGIQPEQESRLFEPFERISGLGELVQGTGVGLSICRKLAELSGGKLGYISEFGVGSTFWLDLPATVPDDLQTEAMGRAERSALLSNLNGTRILYVEENLASIDLVIKLAQQIRDCRIISATNGLEGVALAKSSQPDLFIMGMNMHGLDGFSALELLNKDDRATDLPVIGISAVASPETIRKAHAAGFQEFLAKPIEPDSFFQVIADALTRRERSESQGKSTSLPNQ